MSNGSRTSSCLTKTSNTIVWLTKLRVRNQASGQSSRIDVAWHSRFKRKVSPVEQSVRSEISMLVSVISAFCKNDSGLAWKLPKANVGRVPAQSERQGWRNTERSGRKSHVESKDTFRP